MFVHNIDPTLLKIGIFEIRYYGLVYIIAFILGYFLLRKLTREKHLHIKEEEILDYMIYLAVGLIVGARLFYCFVYNFWYYLPKPWEILFIWNGGMSFHGGFIGAVIAVIWFCRKKKLDLLQMADMTVIPLAIGLSLGRLANFINGELIGRITSVAWCFEFPNADGCRHPSQLYAVLKNLAIFGILWGVRGKKLKNGTIFGIFVVLYSSLRIVIELFRAPDPQIGLILGMTLGQIFSVLMLLFGIGWIYFIQRYHKNKDTKNKKSK